MRFHTPLWLILLQVLPSEKEMKQDLMKNAIYNEYNVEELQTTFRYVRNTLIPGRKSSLLSQHLHNYIHLFRSIGKCCSADFFRNHLNHMTCLLSTIRHIWGSWDVSLRFLEKGKNSQYLKSTKKDLIFGTQKLETHNLIVDLNSIIEEKNSVCKMSDFQHCEDLS